MSLRHNCFNSCIIMASIHDMPLACIDEEVRVHNRLSRK